MKTALSGATQMGFYVKVVSEAAHLAAEATEAGVGVVEATARY